MKNISQEKFVALLEALKGATVIGIEAKTDTGARKTDNPYPEKLILKKTRLAAMLGANYERAVNSELLSTGAGAPEFKSAGLPLWAESVIPGKVVRHKTNGTLYITTLSRPGSRKVSPVKLLGYFDKFGNPIAKPDAEKLITPKKESAKQASAGLDGKEKQVRYNLYKLESLLKVRVSGINYSLTA